MKPGAGDPQAGFQIVKDLGCHEKSPGLNAFTIQSFPGSLISIPAAGEGAEMKRCEEAG